MAQRPEQGLEGGAPRSERNAAESAGDADEPLGENERRVLAAIREGGPSPKSEIARTLGLSATAVGSLMRQLEDRGLVLRGEPQRGRIGQPPAPYRLNPNGALAFGLKIGRRSVELALVNAEMRVVDMVERFYAFPDPPEALDFARGAMAAAAARLSPAARRRICGVGVAMPSEIWSWRDEIDAPDGVLEAWRGVDLAAELSPSAGVVAVVNDGTATTAAELASEGRWAGRNLITYFVGWFAGGGVALNGRLYEGRRGGAGAVGSTPVVDGGGTVQQLIRTASIHGLERVLRAEGRDPDVLWRADADWPALLGPALDSWLDQAAFGLAQSIVAAASVIDFDAAVIDGSLPADVRADLVHRVRSAFERLDRRGLAPMEVVEGKIGRSARAVGAASLPLLARFAPAGRGS